MYLGWFDDSKKATATKIAEAIAAYVVRFKTRPNVVLLNAADAADMPAVEGVAVRSVGYIRVNNFWIGWEG